MKKIFLSLLLFVFVCNLNSRTTRTIIKECKGMYYEKVCFDLPEYYICDDSIKNSLFESLELGDFDGDSNGPSWYLFIECDTVRDTIYNIYLMTSPQFGENAKCFIMLNGWKFFFFGKEIPAFFMNKNRSQMFSYIRTYYKIKDNLGKELEFDVFDEDDGSNWILKFQNNRFALIDMW